MLEPGNNALLPEIPGKRYFSIGEVSELCEVKPHVLRYWEQEFLQLKPVKRRGNRRYYQRQDVLMIRQIRTLLYEKGFTISGARVQLLEQGSRAPEVMSAPYSGHLPEERPQGRSHGLIVSDADIIPVLIENLLFDLEQIVALLSD